MCNADLKSAVNISAEQSQDLMLRKSKVGGCPQGGQDRR